MGLSKTLKMNAKRALAGNWGKAIGIMLLAMLPGILLNIFEFALRAVLGISEYMDYNNTPNIHIDDMASVYSVSLLVSFLILALTFVIIIPLSQGELRWYYRRTGGENDGISSIFYYFETFKQYGKAFWLNLSISRRVLARPLTTATRTVPAPGMSNFASRQGWPCRTSAKASGSGFSPVTR